MAVHLFLARIVDSVIERIPSALRTADNVLETNLAPFKVLDILGFSGHRVVGVSSKNNKMVNYFGDDSNLWFIKSLPLSH